MPARLLILMSCGHSLAVQAAPQAQPPMPCTPLLTPPTHHHRPLVPLHHWPPLLQTNSIARWANFTADVRCRTDAHRAAVLEVLVGRLQAICERRNVTCRVDKTHDADAVRVAAGAWVESSGREGEEVLVRRLEEISKCRTIACPVGKHALRGGSVRGVG